MNREITKKGTQDVNGNYKFKYTTNLYSAYDKIGETYLPLFPAQTDMRAIRMLEDSVSDKNSPIGKHPEDYRLDKIAEIDMRTGKILNNEIRTIIEAKEYANG